MSVREGVQKRVLLALLFLANLELEPDLSFSFIVLIFLFFYYYLYFNLSLSYFNIKNSYSFSSARHKIYHPPNLIMVYALHNSRTINR